MSARWVISPAGILTQWVGVLAGPIAWAIDLLASYALVQWSCGHQNTAVLHLITLGALALTLAGAWAAWRAFVETPPDMPLDPHAATTLHERQLGRARFMAVLGLGTSAFFVVVVIAGAVPRWVLNAC